MRNAVALPLIALSALAISIPAASAAIVASDSFIYTPNTSIIGMNGGTGWASAWSPQTQYNAGLNGATVLADSLQYPNLLTAGGALEALPGYEFADREFFDPPQSSGTYYLSFLIAKGPNAPGTGYGGVSFWGVDNGSEYAFFGYSADRDVNDNTVGPVTPMPASPTATLLVYRIELDTTSYTLYVNPAVGQPEPATPNGTFFGPNTIQAFGLNSEGGYLLDEIRLGTTYADVTPAIPEPGSSALASIAAGCLALRRRRA